MEKEFELPEENDATVNEPMASYGMETHIEILPSLTEEELKDCLTGEEFLESALAHIEKLFDNK